MLILFFAPLSASFMCTTKAMVSWLLRFFASLSAYSILCILEPFCFFHHSWSNGQLVMLMTEAVIVTNVGFIFPSLSTCSMIIECGRTTRNNMLTEVLVFYQTLSTLKASYSGRYPSGTPQGRTRKIHIFSKDPIMRTSYNTSPFHTYEFLKKYIITIPKYQSAEW